MKHQPTIDNFMLNQWEFMLHIVDSPGSWCIRKMPLLYETIGKLKGYGLAHPTPGKLTQAWRMAHRIQKIADRLEDDHVASKRH